MFLIETIKRIRKEMPKVENDEEWSVFKDESDEKLDLSMSMAFGGDSDDFLS